MASINAENSALTLDDEGFLTDVAAWDEEVAQKMAGLADLGELDQEQLAIIKMMRQHYLKYDSFPILANICRKAGSKRRDCVLQKFHNPMLAWKIAGLPKPENVFFTSFDGRRFFPNPFY